ncbi:MAG: PEP/pyruvate-binding domain-containing protein, partial [Chthoniobacterales bacterium]
MPKTRKHSLRTPRSRAAASLDVARNGAAKPARRKKYVYYFGDGKADGDGKMKPLLGGKGANLAEMTRIGLPVPPGFTITTEVCTYYYQNKRTYPR